MYLKRMLDDGQKTKAIFDEIPRSVERYFEPYARTGNLFYHARKNRVAEEYHLNNTDIEKYQLLLDIKNLPYPEVKKKYRITDCFTLKCLQKYLAMSNTIISFDSFESFIYDNKFGKEDVIVFCLHCLPDSFNKIKFINFCNKSRSKIILYSMEHKIFSNLKLPKKEITKNRTLWKNF